MPDYDLGTAHGRIQISVDDRGAQQARRTVTSLEQTMQSLDRRMAAMQTSMSRIEGELRTLSREFQKANEEAENLEASMSDLSNEFTATGRSSRLLNDDFRSLSSQMFTMYRVAQTVIPPLKMLKDVIKGYRSSRHNGTAGIFSGLLSSGVVAAGITTLTKRLLGFNKAMQNASGWQIAMMKFAKAVGTVAAGGAFINWISRGKLNMMLFAKAAGFAATAVGDLSDKVGKFGLRFGTYFFSTAKVFANMTTGLDKLSKGIAKTFDVTTRFGQGMVKLASGSVSVAVGFGLMRHGATQLAALFKNLGWAGKIVLASIAAMATIGPAALEVLGKALVGTSNLLIGLWDGIKQISGGLLAWPGAIAMSIAAFSSLKVAFKGLSDAFKDIFNLEDDAVAEGALGKLKPHLKALGQEFFNLRPKLKDFKVAVQSAFVNGAETQVKALAEVYLPLLQKGMVRVATSARTVKDSLVEFLLEAQTGKDVDKIYNLTAQAFMHLAQAIKPAMAGMRDIAVVGAEFITQLSAGMPDLLQRFAEWAALNRRNGNIMQWISESWQGVKDLTKGIISASKAIGALLTLFKTNNGDNFLKRFANAMERFNNTVQKSAAEGTLKKIGDYVRKLGSESIAKLTDVFRSLFDVVQDAAPVIRDIGTYASEILVPAFKLAAQIVETFFDILDASNLAPIIGLISGLATAFGLVFVAIKPIINVVQVLIGAFGVLGGAKKIIEGISDVLYNFGAVGRGASAGINMLTAAFTKLSIILAVVAAAWLSYQSNAEYLKSSAKLIDDSLSRNKKNFEDLQKAFISDRGKMGKTTMDQITQNVQDNMSILEEQAGKAPGLWDHFNNFMSTAGKNQEGGFGQSADFNRSQEIFDNAKRIQEAFKQVGVSQQEITTAISQGGPAYENLVQKLQAIGYSGELAAGQLTIWREEVQKIQEATAALGEGGLAVVDGLQQIANAAGDANAKLNGLKTVLEGLGIIKTTALQATMAYADGVRQLQTEVANAIVPGENLNNIIDKQTGSFSENSQTASNLVSVFAALSQEYMNAISNGKDAGQAYAAFDAQLQGLVNTLNNAQPGLNMTKEQLAALAQEAGMFDPSKMQNTLNQFLNDPAKKPYLIELGIDQAELDKIKKQLPNLFDDITNSRTGNGPHGGYADKAKAAAKAQKEQAESEFKVFAENLTKTLNEEAGKANEAGSKFSQALADGINSNPAAVQAAKDMAQRLRDQFHSSPPKEGPLSEHGDAAKYSGRMFVQSYAQGVASSLGYVKTASGQVATMMSNGVGGGSAMPGAQAGKFFGDLLELTNFAQRFTSVIQKISDTVFKALKFASDPMGEGKFFGRNLGYRKTVSDEELLRRRNDRLFADYQSMRASGQRDTTRFESLMDVVRNAENAALDGIVRDENGRTSTKTAKTVGAMIKEMFPEIAMIGGARDDQYPFHREGRALDIMIPSYNTPEGRELGDRINQWALSNSKLLGIDYTIWQDFFQPTDGRKGNKMNRQGDTPGHYDHVHINFAPGAEINLNGLEMTPEESKTAQKDAENKAKRAALDAVQEQYGPPNVEGVNGIPDQPQPVLQFDDQGNPVMVTPHGTKNVPLTGYNNPATGQPYTDAEIEQFKKDNPMQYTMPDGMTMEQFQEMLNNQNEFGPFQSQEEMLRTMAESSSAISQAQAIENNPSAFSESQIAETLVNLDSYIEEQNTLNTAISRAQASQAETMKSGIMDMTGMTKAQNPVDTISTIASQAFGVTSDIIGTITSSIEAVGAADSIAKTLVRGMSSTKDVDRTIDDVQKFIELGSKVAGSVASVSGLAASIAGAGGAGDPSGGASAAAAALGSVSTIASLIQAGYETTNAVIDLTQEALRIVGGYVGDFLGYLVGGPNGQLTGNVKFLLDQQTNQLLTYSAENPMDKRTFDRPFRNNDTSSREQMIGNINVYGGPGSDPRDLTRQMMFQVNSAQYAGALSQ